MFGEGFLSKSALLPFLLITDVLWEEENVVSRGHGATFNPEEQQTINTVTIDKLHKRYTLHFLYNYKYRTTSCTGQ